MMGENVASIELVADHSRLAAGLRAAAGVVNSWAASTRSALASVALAPGKAMMNIGRAGLLLGQFGVANRGVDAMVDMTKGVFDFERNLTRFGIAANMSATNLAEYRKEARATSVATGTDANVVLASARAYVDLAGATNASIEKMKILARTGSATGAEGKDLAGMMYQLTRSMKVTDAQMEDTMGGLVQQAKDGAIEAKQMAAEFAGMMPIFARFGVTGREGAIQLGAMYQVTRDGFDSAAQAATGMIRLMAGFQRHASRFKAWGIEVFKPGSKHELRSMADIMAQVHRNPLSKDIEALIKAFGRSEAWRTFELLNEAPDRLKALEEAGRRNGVITQDLATWTESAAGRMDVAFEKMKNGFAEALTPERVDQIVSGIGSMANAMGPLMTAVGGLAGAFGKFVHMVARAKNMLQGDSKLELSEGEKDLADRDRMAKQGSGHVIPLNAAERARLDAVQARQKNYNEAIGSIMSLEDDFGPTDASIKRAIQFARSWYGSGPKMAGDEASISYLKARDKDISEQRMKRLEAEVAAEDRARLSVLGFNPTEKYEMKLAEESTRKLIAGIAAAITGRPNVLQVDGNPVAKAGGNATDRRRK
jgi:TP901 family phage tail tape measure protein